jgi:hypothetical protein
MPDGEPCTASLFESTLPTTIVARTDVDRLVSTELPGVWERSLSERGQGRRRRELRNRRRPHFIP